MTKKDYILIAGAIRRAKNTMEYEIREGRANAETVEDTLHFLVGELGVDLKAQNSRFNFMAFCSYINK